METVRYDSPPGSTHVYAVKADDTMVLFAVGLTPDNAAAIVHALNAQVREMDELAAPEVERPNPFRTNPLGDKPAPGSARAYLDRMPGARQVASAHGPGVNITQAGGNVVVR